MLAPHQNKRQFKQPQPALTVSVEISADYSNGVSDQITRAVAENATNLNFKTKTWE